MTVQVRYFTRSGNTKRLAEAVADAVGVTAAAIDVPLTGYADVLFLGCSYYAFDMDEAVKQFIKANKENIGTIVCVGTSAMMKSMKKPLKKVADAIGVTVCDEEFHCRGEFKFTNKGRPNTDDLERAAQFAQKVVAAKQEVRT